MARFTQRDAEEVASLTKPDNFCGIPPSSFSTGIPSVFATLMIQRGFLQRFNRLP
jgi:hypothetical protein